MAHRCNLAAKSLSALPVFTIVEQLIQKIHAYFNKSSKRFFEYQKLVEAMETKGLKPLLQVTMRRVSLLEPLHRLLADYCTLMAKMKADYSKNEAPEVFHSCPYCFAFTLSAVCIPCIAWWACGPL